MQRPNIEAMSTAELAAFIASPRTCRGPCKRELIVADFELTTERGKLVVRTACKLCMKAYYRADKRRLARNCPGVYLISRVGPLWEVRKITGCGKRLVSRHDREQDAEREVRGLLTQ